MDDSDYDEGSMTVNVAGGAYACCGGGAIPRFSGDALKKIVFVVVALVVLGLIIYFIYSASKERATGGVYSQNINSNRMSVVNNLPGAEYDGLATRNGFRSDPAQRSTQQRERLAEYDAVTDIPADDSGDCSGHQTTTPEEDLPALLHG